MSFSRNDQGELARYILKGHGSVVDEIWHGLRSLAYEAVDSRPVKP